MDGTGGTKASISAIVRVVLEKERYAIAYPEKGQRLEGTEVTFSLQAWRGSTPPLRGQCIELSQVFRFEKGWRSLSVAPITLETGV